ncbi:twin-arginine translocation signal domain-containing protein, partial [bacterium]|nr:twin-arginine translocation signal domain-containing protein [bacterium]
MEGSMAFQEFSIKQSLLNRGVSRRDFLKFCSLMAGALALPKESAAWIASALTAPKRVPVVWLELQDCAGCSEAFLRSNNPTAAEVILDILSVDYHETIMAAAGKQAEEAKAATIAAGGYLLVVEGSPSVGDNGVYCCIGGRSSEDLLREAASNALAVVAIGNCATFGGIPKAKPNPTGAVAVMDLITDKPVLNIPGCPLNPQNLTATVVHFLTFGSLPEMDKLHRPLFAFGQLIHNNCERRGHFDAGEFVRAWGDAGHRAGWCLYQMGCKGPITMHNCSVIKYNDGTNWPIGAGHPCIGCSEPNFWDQPTYVPIKLDDFLPPSTYPAVGEVKGQVTPQGAAVTAGAVGLVAGAALAFGYTVMTGRAKGVTPEVSEEEPSEEG